MTLEVTSTRNSGKRRRLSAESAPMNGNFQSFTELVANLGAGTRFGIVTNPASAKRASVNER
jgi:hypothetical protein